MGRSGVRFLMVLVASIGVLGAACSSTGSSSQAVLRGLVRDEPLLVGDVVVTEVDRDGTQQPLTLRAAPKELLVVYFGFTSCPDVCPTTLADLRAARQRLGDDRAARVDLAMITVDPERDLPPVLVGYLGGFAPRFHAVRPADRGELTRAQDAFLAASSISVGDDGRVEVAHSTATYVVDAAGVVVVEWPFAAGIETMAHDLKVLFDRMDTAAGGA
jgi:protein SCO1/2